MNFYTQLKGSLNIARSDDIVTDAKNGALPELSMVWHDSPYDEYPVADVTRGQDKVWRAVDAIVTAGLWDTTVFLLSWDDWGGSTTTSGPRTWNTPPMVSNSATARVPLLIFGGPVKTSIDSRWNAHPSVGKTVLDLLGLPPLGVPRLDSSPTLADLVDTTATPSATPAPYGTTITQPTPPSPAPTPTAAPPPPTSNSAAAGPVLLRDGSTLPPPSDQPVT